MGHYKDKDKHRTETISVRLSQRELDIISNHIAGIQKSRTRAGKRPLLSRGIREILLRDAHDNM